MAEKPKEPKRFNRAVGVADALRGTLDPMLKKRGFASRDIIDRWRAIAPSPYDTRAVPDRLAWPRSEASAGGATLYLRCDPAIALMLAHEGSRIASAVNRYFGYLLVNQVRLSAEPFRREAGPAPAPDPELDDLARARLDRAVDGVKDAGLRAVIERLGTGVFAAKKR